MILSTCHCEPEALHHMVLRAKGVAISFFLRLLRRPAARNDNLFASAGSVTSLLFFLSGVPCLSAGYAEL
jgi:hypothetical protein